VKKTFISAAAILAFAATAHADERSDIQAQSKQLREQNQALMKRLSDLEKRQKNLEAQTKAQQPAVSAANPVDAMAADLPYKAAVKAKPPADDGLCWSGVCLYGNIDMGLTYENHGAPLSAMAAAPLDYLVSKNSNGSYFGAGPNAMSNSFIGLRGKQEIADNLYAVFNLQTLFNPENGTVSNGIGSVQQNNGLSLAQQNAYGDSSKAGQMFSNVAYAGISSPIYGTLTYGRQSALSSDAVVNYDPNSGANAFSVITYSGATGGAGDTENRIYDNSFEYRVNVGPARFAVETQLQNGGNSGTGNAFEGDVGFDYMGFSFDAIGAKVNDAVSAAPLSSAQVQTLNSVANTNVPQGIGAVAATVSDNTSFMLVGRYTYGPLKLYGGYERIDYSNPSNPLLPGAFIEGGYTIGAPNNANFTTDKILNVFWFGAKYAVTPNLDITGAYYGERQNSFQSTAASSAALLFNDGGKVVNLGGTCTNASSAACSGQLDAVSVVVDWRFARHFDMYAGVMWSEVQNGLASGFLLTNGNTLNKVSVYDPTIGLRYQF
jgi:predicted porin